MSLSDGDSSSRSARTYFRYMFLGILFSIWAGMSVFWGYHYFFPETSSGIFEEQKMKDQLSRLIAFDGGEVSVATIADAEKLKATESFYQRAKNGDTLIIWEKKAIIYRKEIGKIIDLGIVVEAKEIATSGSERGSL